MRPALASAWRWVAGAVVLALVVREVGAGPVRDGLRALDVRVLLLGLALGVVTTVASAWRWTLVARQLDVAITLPRAVASCYRAQLLNTVLPGGVLGDVHRGVAHGRATGATGRALRAVAWERLAGQVVQGVLTAVVLVALPSPLRPLLPWLLAATAVAVLLAAVALRRTPGSDAWWSRAARVVRDDVRLALLVRRAWPGVVLASVVTTAGYAATLVLAARAVGVEAPVATLLPLVLVVLGAAALPLNLAGWGPREGAAAWAFGAAGAGASAGMATAVAYGALVLLVNLPGLVVLVAARRTRPVAEPVRGEPARA